MKPQLIAIDGTRMAGSANSDQPDVDPMAAPITATVRSLRPIPRF